MSKRYLTKSRFKLGLECPTKLYYTGKKDYANQRLDDQFLQSLADGGFKVGELAKAYYPTGHDIETLDIDDALRQTNQLLQQENCIIFEAAIKYNNLFVRVDILIKNGNDIDLIEVKSKSFSENDIETFLNNNKITSEWKPYLYDIAFKYYVAKQSFTEYNFTPYLMLVNKDAEAPTDELHQKIKIGVHKSGRRYSYLHEPLTEVERNEKILINVDTKPFCQKIITEEKTSIIDQEVTFSELVSLLADHYENDKRVETGISSACRECEFKATDSELEAGLKSGYRECFKRYLEWEEQDFQEDTIFNLRGQLNREALIKQNKIKFSDLTVADIGMPSEKEVINTNTPLNTKRWRWLQLTKAQNNDSTPFINKKALKKEIANWTYPYHFIDFETSLPRIPLFKGEKPNSYIAFQFSHHVVHEDGTIEHQSEYLNTKKGVNPNVDFVRHLKQSLGNDNGTIFRYSYHENTVLNKIKEQLIDSEEDIADKEELIKFIMSITQPSGGKGEPGPRNMVDLCALVEKYYFDPYMKGSTSLKYVLPAILNSSSYIQNKYKEPIYGTENGIKSSNFENKAWVVFENGEVLDPYSLLPKLFTDLSNKEYELLRSFEDINNGTAAMTAYERLQSEDIPEHLRKEIEEGMLKYCELDTLAMVLIYENWKDMIY